MSGQPAKIQLPMFAVSKLEVAFWAYHEAHPETYDLLVRFARAWRRARGPTAIVGIAGELVKGTTTTVHYERGNPEARIDFPELKNIIQKVQAKAYQRIQEQISWETGQDIDVKLINAAIVDVRIDGYQVTNPI